MSKGEKGQGLMDAYNLGSGIGSEDLNGGHLSIVCQNRSNLSAANGRGIWEDERFGRGHSSSNCGFLRSRGGGTPFCRLSTRRR